MSLFSKKSNTSHFIIAAPRSGTTWLSKMLNAHPQIFCAERRLFGNYADFVKDEGRDDPRLRVTLDKYVNSLLLHHGLSGKKSIAIQKALIETILEQELKYSGKKILIDKITPYLNTSETVIRSINNYFPKAKIIYLVRDGRDVLTSGVFHWFNKQLSDTGLNSFERERRELFLNDPTAQMDRFFQDKEIEQWAREWSQPLQTIGKAKEKHPVKIVHYEDLLIDAVACLKEMLDFYTASSKEAIIKNCENAGQFKKMSGGRNKGEAKQGAHVRKGIKGDWRNYFTAKDGELFQEIAGNELLKFGYEDQQDWWRGLR